MLSPRYLDGCADELVEIYSQLETDILADMARRIARVGKVTESTKWQARVLAEAGALKKDVARITAKYDKLIQDEINAIYNDALIKSARADSRIFREAIGQDVSAVNAQMMLASIQKTRSDLSRLTITTAYTTETQFIQQANNAYMQVVSGAFDYDSAMRNACNNLAERGITAVQYRNGTPVTLQIENAVRMNILTGVNQTSAQMTLNNCEELGCDLVETTAHIGARPEHEAWQGQVFSLSGTSKKYKPFSVCRLGEVDGICGINCRHSYYPFFEGLEKHYSADELDDMAKQTVTYNGKQIPRYEAEQELRGIERNIRKYKRQAVTQEAGGVDNTRARQKLGEWQEKSRDFTAQTRLERDRAREFIGTATGRQPTSITPAAAAMSKNVKLAHEIKRLDNSRNKLVSGVSAGAPMTFKQADGSAPNPNYRKGGGYSRNCQTCVVAYEMRRRGYNVQALPKTDGSMLDVLSRNTSLAWIDRNTGKNPAYIIPAARTAKSTVKFLETSIKTQNRYTIEFAWKGGYGGHIIHLYKDISGTLIMYDPQIAESYRGRDAVLDYLKRVKPSTVKLLDVENYDVNLNVLNAILEAAK